MKVTVTSTIGLSTAQKRFIVWEPNFGLKVGDIVETKIDVLGVGICGDKLFTELSEEVYNATSRLSSL